jgi:hypothetical protein
MGELWGWGPTFSCFVNRLGGRGLLFNDLFTLCLKN